MQKERKRSSLPPVSWAALAAGLLLALLAYPAADAAADETPGTGSASLRRFAIFVGADYGGRERIPLRYASSDARQFALLMEEMGGVEAGDRRVLIDPDAEMLRSEFALMRKQVAGGADARRTEFIFYYSGHSDEAAVLLGDDRLSYPEIRELIESMQADVSIAVLDSCSSGAFTRQKGGTRSRPFLMDDASSMKGHAYLTSSSADEASQESDLLGASFFTHFLVSGLRGAADHTRDGRITLNEIYQYAFDETLARTESTQAGPQHPSYEIQLTGTGDLVLTDLSVADATLELAPEIQGRVAVRTQGGLLLAEMEKRPGIPLTVALPPGLYRLVLNQSRGTFETTARVDRGAAASVSNRDFSRRVRETARTRGDLQDPVAEEPLPADPAMLAGTPEAAYRPFHLAVVPGFPQPFARPAVNNISLGLLVAETYSVRGLQYSFLIGSTEDDLVGLQSTGIGGIVGRNLQGIQHGGVFNILRGDGVGLQAAGVFNISEGSFRGGQGAGIFNVNGGDSSGLQLAGLFNVNGGDLRGLQAAGIFNVAEDVRGAQVGLVNTGDTIRGVQVGLINIANEVDGLPLGVLNFIRDGIHDASFWYDDQGYGWMGFQTGSRRFYTLLFGGIRAGDALLEPDLFTAGIGVGMRFEAAPFYLDADLSAKHAFRREPAPDGGDGGFEAPSTVPSLRFTAGIRFGGVALFGGLTWDLGVGGAPDESSFRDGERIDISLFDTDLRLYGKYAIGISF